MVLDDLMHIFNVQLEEGTRNLYYMLIDNEYKVVQRHPADRIEDLVPMLDCFTFDGYQPTCHDL